MNQDISDFIGRATAHTVTVRGPEGNALVETKAVHVFAAGVAAVLLAPRLAAAAAVGALLAGVTVSVEPSGVPTEDPSPA